MSSGRSRRDDRKGRGGGGGGGRNRYRYVFWQFFLSLKVKMFFFSLFRFRNFFFLTEEGMNQKVLSKFLFFYDFNVSS